MMKWLQIKFWEKERSRIVAQEAVAFTSFFTQEAFSKVPFVLHAIAFAFCRLECRPSCGMAGVASSVASLFAS
jgi:hypothetical protein